MTGLEWDGHRVEVRRSSRRRKTVTAYREADAIVVVVPARMRSAEITSMVADLVPRVLAKEQRSRPPRGDAALLSRAAELAADHLADQPGYRPPDSVRWVTNQQHRWGSCSVGSRAIRLSHRLQTMPSWVVDYVLFHELVHLIHPDHSAAFWALVHRRPDAERARGYLEGWSDAAGVPAVEG